MDTTTEPLVFRVGPNQVIVTGPFIPGFADTLRARVANIRKDAARVGKAAVVFSPENETERSTN